MEVATINVITEKELVEQLRNQYTQTPPEGMNSNDIKHMSDNDLLDMDYFLHENVFGAFDD